LTSNMDFESLMQEAVAQNITVTTVALGRDADRTLMDAIAHWGQGRSYYTDDPLNIPRIFTAETILVSRGLIEEQPFQAALQTEHEIFSALSMTQSPPLYGYVVTYAKPAAELLLTTPKSDPLLAVQRYGLGRTAAFTSDLSARWAKDWIRWPQFNQFAAQLVRWIQRKGTAESFDIRVDIREGQAIVQTDVFSAEDQFVNKLNLQGKLLTPNKETLPMSFTQTAPGRYQSRFPVQGNGEYLLSFTGKQGDVTIGPKTLGVSLPYSSEYLGLDINYALLNRLAESTGGHVLRPGAPEEAADLLFSSTDQGLTDLQDYWPWFVALALCLFIVEIAVRQVLLPTSWTARFQRQQPAPEPTTRYTYGDLETIVHRRADERHQRSLSSTSRGR
jgi:hypothetical protein